MYIYPSMTDLTLTDRYAERVPDAPPDIRVLNILISFGYFNGQLPILRRLIAEGKVNLKFLDCEAFRMNPNGCNPGLINEVTLYRNSVKRYWKVFDWITCPDDRFEDYEHNLQNYFEFCDEFSGLVDDQGRTLIDKLVPGIHSNDPASEVLFYAQQGVKMIGIGSKPMISMDQWEKISAIRDQYGFKLHRFGNLGFKDIIRYRINSADSARYARATMHGRSMWFWDADTNKLENPDLRDNKELKDKHLRYLQETFQWSWSDVMSDATKIWIVNIHAHQFAQKYLTEVVGI